MRHIVQTTSGKTFCTAAEVAAVNRSSTVRPVANVLVPEPAKEPGEMQRKMEGKKSDQRSGDGLDTPEKTEDESDEEEGEGEEWLGKEEGFVSAISKLPFPSVRPCSYLRHVCRVRTYLLLPRNSRNSRTHCGKQTLTLGLSSGSNRLRRRTLRRRRYRLAKKKADSRKAMERDYL